MANKIFNVSYHGDFNKAEKLMENLLNYVHLGKLDKYGRLGVEYLKKYTPKDTGLTSESWVYHIEYTNNEIEIVWTNTNIQNGENIALLLQYGHGTGTGGYVKGIDYINPSLKKVFNKIKEDARKEVFGIL